MPLAYDEPIDAIEGSPVEATLVADATAIVPGGSLQLGVLLRMQPGWYVFWRDPGDAGLPTDVNLRAPEGFSVDAIRWPTPASFMQPGDLVGYGYDDWVLLATTVRAPTELTPGARIPLRARVRWLTCERVCVPGEADLEHLLPVAEASTPDNENIFETWRRRLPVQADTEASPARVVTTRETSGAGVTRFDVVLEWSTPPSGVEWLPVHEAAFQILISRVEHLDTVTHVEFTAESTSASESPPAILEVVVAYADSAGVRRGLELQIPLRDGLAPP